MRNVIAARASQIATTCASGERLNAPMCPRPRPRTPTTPTRTNEPTVARPIVVPSVTGGANANRVTPTPSAQPSPQQQAQQPDVIVRYDSTVTIDSVFVFVVDSVFVPVGDSLVRWRFGVGAGVSSLFVFGGGGMEFFTPVTLSVFAQHDNRWFITLAGGWRPMSEVNLGGNFPANLNRAESILSASASLYPKRSVLGAAFTLRGAWETVRREDEYLERAYGLSLGPRLRLRSHVLVLGLDFQLVNESRFRGAETAWRFGIAPTISINHTFGRRRDTPPPVGTRPIP